MAIQSIKRAAAQPPPGALITDDPQQIALINWLRLLSQQVNAIENAFQQFKVTVAGGAGNTTVTLPAPYYDALYIPLVIPSWSTTVYIAAPGDITSTNFKITYGTAAPGGGGTLYVLTCR